MLWKKAVYVIAATVVLPVTLVAVVFAVPALQLLGADPLKPLKRWSET